MEKTAYQICSETLLELGFSGEDGHYDKGLCHVWIMDDQIRMSFYIPGADKEYIGPPLPSRSDLIQFIEKNSPED